MVNMKTTTSKKEKSALKHLIFTLILAVLLISSFVLIPFSQIFNPETLNTVWDCTEAYDNGERYVTVTIDIAYYTGYDVMTDDEIEYSYYYCISGDDCMFLMLETENQPEILSDYTVTGELVKSDSMFTTMITSFATDLGWKSSSLLEHTESILIDQTGYHPGLYTIIFVLLLILLIISVIYAVHCIRHILK